ncbi:hypothetical protein Droror1_Dr00018119 [Drosera rotundifolia]
MLSPETIPSPPPVCATVVRKPTLKSTSNEDNIPPNGRITSPISGTTQDTTSEPNHAASMANPKSPPPKPQFNSHQVQLSAQSTPQDKLSHSNDYTRHHHSPTRGVTSVGGASNGCGGGDGLLQWGQRKRTRNTRPAEKMPSTAAMAPPAPARAAAMNGRSRARMTQNGGVGGFNGKVASGFLSTRNRNLEDPATASPSRNGGRRDMGTTSTSRSAAGGKRSQPLMEKQDRRVTCYYGLDRKEKSADSNHVEENGGGGAQNMSVGGGGGGGCGGEVVEWPRIYISLSRKEKEDDFYAMKGTKLPHRPKKRSKAIDRALQYCFPGMWLSDLTRARYEVRERKSKKPKRRGLKGLENMDSDSE